MNKGFTLIELLIVIGITAIIATGSFLFLGGYKNQQSLIITSRNLITFLRDAQSRAVAQENGLDWGVRFINDVSATNRDSYHLFSGSSYVTPVSVVAFPSSVEFDAASGPFPKDVIFQKSTGRPISASNVILRLKANTTATKTITINAQGTILEQ